MKNRLTTTEMRCLRMVVGVTRGEKVGTDIKIKVGTEPVIDYIQR